MGPLTLTIRSRNNLEKISNARSPLPDVSMTIGTSVENRREIGRSTSDDVDAVVIIYSFADDVMERTRRVARSKSPRDISSSDDARGKGFGNTMRSSGASVIGMTFRSR